jgi:hypothetical protein
MHVLPSQVLPTHGLWGNEAEQFRHLTWVPGEALAFVTLRATMSDGDGKLLPLPLRCASATGDSGGLPRSPPNREALLRRALSTRAELCRMSIIEVCSQAAECC